MVVEFETPQTFHLLFFSLFGLKRRRLRLRLTAQDFLAMVLVCPELLGTVQLMVGACAWVGAINP